ncbi:gametocyte-specific factor 1 homolog [Cloeon dipterum]|uniref:gametocyte-specific factor 1 homolog n=1 Tax=Cloeon dipterum TaxID=197152 RepID=UPI00322081FA
MASSSRTHGPFYVDKLVICPLVESHVILESRLQYHIVRCIRTFPHPERVQKCPFNATHLILLPNSLEEHMANCADSNSLIMYKYSGGEKSSLKETLHPMNNREIPCEEDWSDVVASKAPSYDFLEANDRGGRPNRGAKKKLPLPQSVPSARRRRERFAGQRVEEEVNYNPLTAGLDPDDVASNASTFSCFSVRTRRT